MLWWQFQLSFDLLQLQDISKKVQAQREFRFDSLGRCEEMLDLECTHLVVHGKKFLLRAETNNQTREPRELYMTVCGRGLHKELRADVSNSTFQCILEGLMGDQVLYTTTPHPAKTLLGVGGAYKKGGRGV